MMDRQNIPKTGGHLVLIGGKEDKDHDKLILRRILTIGSSENVAVIPTASDYPGSLFERYRRAFTDLGACKVSRVDVRSNKDAGKEKYLDMIRRAEVIFFTGGDQVKLVRTLADSPLLKEIWRKYRSGATLAGTSAGAAAAGDPLIYDGDYNGFKKGTVRFSKGFGFLNSITVDSHFISRGRLTRLVQFLAGLKSKRGIGLAENTGIVVFPDHHFEVIGNGMVTLLDARRVHFNNYAQVKENESFTVDGIRLSFLAPGAFFSLEKWRVCAAIPPVDQRKSIKINIGGGVP